eukprot:259233_1
MQSLYRLTSTKASQSQSIHHQIQRHFTPSKLVPQLTRRQNIPITLAKNVSKPTPKIALPSTHTSKETDPINDEEEEDNVFSNKYYSRLLNQKLDSCPPQPFNERTNILWSAIYETREKGNNIDLMSRWEQIQNGYVRNKYTKYDKNKYIYGTNNKYDYDINKFMDVNDIMNGKTYNSLDDINTNNYFTLAKSTGSLNNILDNKEKMDRIDKGIQMKGDIKWWRRRLKLHIKKKRRENMRMKKKTMQQRNKRNDS